MKRTRGRMIEESEQALRHRESKSSERSSQRHKAETMGLKTADTKAHMEVTLETETHGDMERQRDMERGSAMGACA